MTMDGIGIVRLCYGTAGWTKQQAVGFEVSAGWSAWSVMADEESVVHAVLVTLAVT